MPLGLGPRENSLLSRTIKFFLNIVINKNPGHLSILFVRIHQKRNDLTNEHTLTNYILSYLIDQLLMTPYSWGGMEQGTLRMWGFCVHFASSEITASMK